MKRERKVYILIQTKNHDVLDVWTNLKKLCEDMNNTEEGFASYSKLSKMSESKQKGRLEFESKKGKAYVILIKSLR